MPDDIGPWDRDAAASEGLKRAERIARRLTRSRPDLEDVAIDGAVNGLLKALEKFRPEAGWRAWAVYSRVCVVRGARRTVRRALEKEGRRPGTAPLHKLDFDLPDPRSLAGGGLSEDVAELLTPGQRRAVELVYVQKMTQREAAKAEGIGLARLRRRLADAAERLRAAGD